MNCSPPGSSVHGILQQEYWSGVQCPPPGELPNPGIKHKSPASPALAGGFLTTSTTWEAPYVPITMLNSAFVFKTLSLLHGHIQYYMFF